MPHSIDREYAERSIPQYERAVELAGGEAARVPLDAAVEQVRQIIECCDGVLLPGSNADVDPAKFKAERSPHSAGADPRRDAADALLLEDAYHLRKPVLGICYGLQSLNVFRAGSLVQHIPDFLPEELRARVNHEAGKKVAVAHAVEIERDSKLAEILHARDRDGRDRDGRDRDGRDRGGRGLSRTDGESGSVALAPEGSRLILPVNSSHHQSADVIGDGLCISARCPDDGIIEALEGTATDHFVLAVQWHPERSVEEDEASRAIFRALITAADARRK
jgi:putative glutamine amidotransferase